MYTVELNFLLKAKLMKVVLVSLQEGFIMLQFKIPQQKILGG